MGLPLRSSNVVEYTNVALATTGKNGVLKKLDGNYYEIILGAFGAFGNGGWLYDERTAMNYLNNNHEFRNLIQRGQLRSEWGHPRRQPGMTDMEWIQRIHEIYEPNWSSHIRTVRTSFDTVKDERGRAVVAIIGEVCPTGPNAQAFREQLENPHEDVNYSIRSFASRDYRTMRKHINKIITWDNVFTPGISVASKYKTPSLESKSYVANVLDQAEFDLDRLREELTSAGNDASFESNNEAFKLLSSLTEQTSVSVSVPRALQW